MCVCVNGWLLCVVLMYGQSTCGLSLSVEGPCVTWMVYGWSVSVCVCVCVDDLSLWMVCFVCGWFVSVNGLGSLQLWFGLWEPDTYVGAVLSRQDRFGKIYYKIIGDDTAPKYFSINTESGQVKLKEKVETDTLTEYQVRGRGHTHSIPCGCL